MIATPINALPTRKERTTIVIGNPTKGPAERGEHLQLSAPDSLCQARSSAAGFRSPPEGDSLAEKVSHPTQWPFSPLLRHLRAARVTIFSKVAPTSPRGPLFQSPRPSAPRRLP